MNEASEDARDGETRSAATSVPVWDPATRLFHWALVALVAINVYTGLVGGLGEMELHKLSGYAILSLVLFRLLWGFAGSRHSRFADFVKGPRSVLAYARRLAGAGRAHIAGHNPLGGWSVMAMLLVLLVQAATGLFANDDIFTEGPLARKVTKATSDALTAVHKANARILFVLIAVHLAAVLGYLLVKRENLILPMVTGRRPRRPGESEVGEAFVPQWRAVVALAAAALSVWWILRL